MLIHLVHIVTFLILLVFKVIGFVVEVITLCVEK